MPAATVAVSDSSLRFRGEQLPLRIQFKSPAAIGSKYLEPRAEGFVFASQVYRSVPTGGKSHSARVTDAVDLLHQLCRASIAIGR
jgi:hypothetical protein